MKVTADLSLAKKMTPQMASKITVMDKSSNKISGLGIYYQLTNNNL